MADFENIPIDVSAEDIENVAKRPYKIVARPPTGLDTGETGQWWIEIDNETEEVIQIYQRVGFEWVSYLNAETKIAGLNLKDEISVEDLLTALDVYPLIIDSDPPTTSTKGYNKQMYFDIENATLYVSRGLVGTGYLWEKAFPSGYVPTSRKIAGIDLADDITIEEMQDKLSVGYIRSLDGAPNNKTVGKVGEIIYTTEWNPSTGAKNIHKLYRCNQINEAEGNYSWGELTYVPISRKVAGLVLENDITVEQLQTTLGIGDIETALDNIIAIQENLIGGDTE